VAEGELAAVGVMGAEGAAAAGPPAEWSQVIVVYSTCLAFLMSSLAPCGEKK
jgi:hypothetical protein